MNIDKIISESIEQFLKEGLVDKFTPYTPEEARINKAAIGHVGNPSYDNAEKANTSARSGHIMRGYSDWSSNYRDVLDYPSYCKKFGVRR